MELPIALTVLVLVILWALLTKGITNTKISNGHSPISLPMAVHYEHAKFKVRYRNVSHSQELYKLGIRNGQFGIILKTNSGMYAKVNTKGAVRFVHIQAYNYTPQEQ